MVMKWIKKLYFKQVAVILAMSIFIIGSIPAKSMAYVVGTEAVAASTQRAADVANIQRILESKLVSERLSQAGLSMTEIKSRLDKLSDEEVHGFSSQLETVYPGGDALGVVIALLIIVILVMVILKLSNRQIVIR